MPSGLNDKLDDGFDELLVEQPTKKDQQIEELQKKLTYESDARKEERFVFLVMIVLLLDVVFFSVMPTFTGPIALVLLELLILIPLAQRMGMEEIAKLLSRTVDRVTGKMTSTDE